MDIRRSTIIIALVVFALFALLLKPEILSSLFIFIFLGIIPGTAITLPWWVMMLGFLIALVFGIRWLFDQPVYNAVATTQDKNRRHAARKRVLKQTSRKSTTKRHYKKQPARV